MGEMSTMDLFSSITINPAPRLHRFLKWKDEIVGDVLEDNTICFREYDKNHALDLITGGDRLWNLSKVEQFLEERVVSKSRRGIGNLLARYGISNYNLIKIANITRAFSSKDLLWFSDKEDEKFQDILPEVFSNIFRLNVDMEGDPISSPEGYNEKRYAVVGEEYGILKKRMNPRSSDVESEFAVYKIATALGVPCCKSVLVEEDKDVLCFSKFEYRFEKEFLVHFRRLFNDNQFSDNLYKDLVSKVPSMKEDIQKMIILDFVTRQDDRHLSNFALLVKGDKTVFYPLYDNGRSLFFEDSERTIREAVDNIVLYSTQFGQSGTYYDFIMEIVEDVRISELVDLSISDKSIEDMYSCIPDTLTREGAIKWTSECLKILRRL